MNKKTVLITGASKGIGLALAKKMLDENFVVIGTSRSGKITTLENDDFYPVKLDLSQPNSIENACNKISTEFSSIDILINNAGIGPDLYTQYPETETFNTTFEVNTAGTVFFTEKLIDIINNKGLIFNISSKIGSIDACRLTDSVAYRMSKSALNMYTKILANRLKGNIKVAAIHPGWVKTAIIESNLENARLTPEESAESMFELISSDFKNGTFWDAESNCGLAW